MAPPSLTGTLRPGRDLTRPASATAARGRFAAIVAHLPRRARAILAVALVLLIWRCGAPSQSRKPSLSSVSSRSPSSATAPKVQFASSRLRLPSARVHFENGAVQEVLPSQSLDGRRRYERLWESSRVVRVEVPLGARFGWMDVDGDEGAIERGRGDDCAEEACDDMYRVRLDLDVATGLRQLRDSDPAVLLVLELPSMQPVGPRDVTLVTQLSVSRLERFERMLASWDGPLAAAIYLVDEMDAATLEDHLNSPVRSSAWDRVSLVVVKPDFSVGEEALLTRLRYPINRLRNLALSVAPPAYVLVADVDFVPSPGMHSILSSRGVPLIDRTSSLNSRSPTLRKTAVVIPTFALSAAFDGRYPNSTRELEALVTSDPPVATLTDVNAGHGPTLPSLLFSGTVSSAPRASRDADALDSAASYPVCYEPQWEPYYLLARASHPLYDERFTDQGGDKQSHALVLNALGYEFRVARDVWVVHPPREDRAAEEWPAARLVQRGGRPEHALAAEGGGGLAGAADAEDDSLTHFNLAAQRDESRFRYFQDWLPEMERMWGANVRWPRGCDARVAGRRSFGRARAGTVFGL